MAEKVVRFKKAAYRGENSKGDVPRWHIAAYNYRKGEIYARYLALCGYEIKHPWMKNVDLSIAKAVRGPQCSKCIREKEKASA